MKRKRIWIVLALAALLALPGCGYEGGTASGQPAQSEAASAVPADSAPLSAASEPSGAPGEETASDMPEPTVTPDAPDETAEPQESAPAEPADEELVQVLDYIPSVYVELKYATQDNFTGTVIYGFDEAYLRYGTVKKLAQAQAELLEQGYSLKIWDAYRPVSAQFKLWEVYPDPVYVANPNTGFSSHSRGNTVDVTLVTAEGGEVEMPTGFDDFSALADRDYSDVPEPARGNALLLENVMSACGFRCYSGEWWHFSDSTSYPVAEDGA